MATGYRYNRDTGKFETYNPVPPPPSPEPPIPLTDRPAARAARGKNGGPPGGSRPRNRTPAPEAEVPDASE